MLKAAAGLFSEVGYAASTMEAIAERAEVALSTLYQYFPSKMDLARGIYALDVETNRALETRVINDPPADPVEAVMALIRIELCNSSDYADIETWRQIVIAGLTSPGGKNLGVDPFSERDAEPFRRLLDRLKERGAIAATTDVARLAGLLSTLNFAVFMHRISSGAEREESLAKGRAQVALVLVPLMTATDQPQGRLLP